MNTTTDTLANDTTDNIPTYKRAHIWQIEIGRAHV